MSENSLHPFELVINGENVLPTTVDVIALAPFLKAFRNALEGMAKLNEREHRNLFVCFTHAEVGSNRLRLECNSNGFLVMQNLSRMLIGNERQFLPKKTVRNLGVMNRILEKYGWDSCELRGSKLPSTILAQQESARPTYRGVTTVYGHLFRVGGLSNQTAQMKVQGRPVIVRLKDEEMAVTLGKRLHQTIGLEGEATWYADSDELKEFRAEGISPFQDRSSDGQLNDILESLRELRNASSGRWNNQDPERFVAEQRGDE